MKAKLYFLQRGSLFFTFLLFFQSIFSQQVSKSIPNSTSPDGIIGFLQFTPSDYGSQKHPLIIFLHGIGERGNGTPSQLSWMTDNAIPKFCAAGASMRFTVNGQTSSFVVLSPQLSTQYGYWPTFYVTEMIKYAKANLTIDTNRIYLCGLSLGGGGVWRALTETNVQNGDYTFDAGIAAATPVCGTQEENDGYFCNTIGANHVPIWAFHSMDDGTVPVQATEHAQILAANCGVTPAPLFTYYQSGGHAGAWINAYDTGHITVPTVVNGNVVNFTQSPNLFEWLLSNKRGTTTTPANTAPVANAGTAQTITLPASTVSLTGTGTGTNGATISSYSWSKTSGPSAGNIVSSTAASTSVTGMVQGTYVFTLTVTDNHGLSNSSGVTITVNAANQPPVANAGSNTSITLPTSTATLNGSASNDPDGSISTYSWSKTSGPSSYTITNSGSATTTITNLVQGVYTFTLVVTDNGGATASSTVTVTVNAASNQPPVANAGNNTSITLPTSTATLNGSASSDPDGSISTYAWSKTSGPSSYTITNSGSATTTITNLVQGVYTFTLVVTDNGGATASSTVTITVNAAVNQPPVANAGSNTSITLPTSTATLNGSASNDPDGSISTYSWSKTSGPSSYTITNSGSATTTITNLVQGVYTFTLVVTDNGGATASSTVTVTVNAASNQPPVANAGNNTSITLPTSTATLNGSASSDPDGSISTYAWSKTSGPSSYTITNSGSATTTITNLVQGVYTFTLVVTDNGGATASSTVTVIVNAASLPVNQSPVANAGGNTTITLPVNSVTLDGSASYDPDGSIASYAWSEMSGPASYNIASTVSSTPTVTNLVQGVYTFALVVTDNSGATSSASVTITVAAAPLPVNQSPVAIAGNNINIVLPVNSVNLDGSASYDPDGTISSYAWSATGGPSSYNISNTGSATTTVTNLVQGTYTFTLVVTDNSGATSSSSVNITVAPPPNQPPVANAGANITITLPVNTTNLDGTASADPDGSIVSYSWNKVSGPGAITIVNSNTSVPTVIGLSVGQYFFQLTVTDNDGATGTSQVMVTVNPQPNIPPVADAGKDTSIALPLTSIILSGANSADADGSIVTYKWVEISGPSAAIIQQAGSVVTEIDSLTAGDYVFELQVTDNDGAISTADVKVSVVNNFRYTDFFKLYPNPATSSINLQFIDDKTGKLGIIIYDVDGRLVISQQLSKDQSLFTKQIDISALKSGMYYLELRYADGTKLLRPFVKQ